MNVETRDEKRCEEGEVRVHVSFGEDAVRRTETPFGVDVQLDGCQTTGETGAPALPRATIRVAIPDGGWPRKVEVESAKTVLLVDTPTLVAPVQPLRPGVQCDKGPSDGPSRDHDVDDDDDDDDKDLVEPFPAPPLALPDPEKYEAAGRDCRIIRTSSIDQLGATNVVSVELRPVRLNEYAQLEYTPEFDVVIPYGPRPAPLSAEQLEALAAKLDVDVERLAPLPEKRIVSRGQATRAAELARALVVNQDAVVDIGPRLPWLELPAEYLVITDNRRWNAATITPGGSVGDMVGAFQRLVAWKRSRGLTAKVVTITDIVGGRYGDFRTGSRDLPEVIRKFLKAVHERWGVAWLLLGGDVGIVPTRRTAGAVEGHMDVGTENPPPDNKSFWTGTHLRMHVVGPGLWWPGNTGSTLVNAATGQLIPFDATGATASGGLGWYYTTNNAYNTRSVAMTNFVRVNGPASVVNARLQWLYEWNTIPTDFYYASLDSWVIAHHEIDFWFAHFSVPYVSYPRHDWDALDNGLYGQFVDGKDVDGVLWHADLSVGRAPVESTDEATTFVDKVISYEKFRTPEGSSLDVERTRRVLMASSNWGGPVWITETLNDPPGDNTYRVRTGVTVIRLKDIPAFDRQLIADISDSDRRELPWNGGSAPGTRGWHYARSASDHSLSTYTFSIFGLSFSFPIASNWIVVHGPAEERDPRHFLLDQVAQDGSMADQEQLREQIRAQLPKFDQFNRLYEDETDLTPAQRAAAPVQYLTSDRLRAALNAGPHFVSLSGHGNPEGCCGGSVPLANGLTNGWNTFIGYADSCLTSQYDGEDAFGEVLLKNPSGGAVAYVGSSRFSWIGVGDDVQRAFFSRLTTTRHLGLLNDARLQSLDPTYWHAYYRWIMFSLNVLGDPEMPVWRVPPKRPYRTKVDWNGDRRIPLLVRVEKPGPKPEPDPFSEVLVHVRQNELEWVSRAGAEGVATFDLSQAQLGPVTVTVSADGALPDVRELELCGPVWLDGTVTEVSHREDGQDATLVRLQNHKSELSLVADRANNDYPLIVDAAVEAFLTGREISVLVTGEQAGAHIERFRFRSPART